MKRLIGLAVALGVVGGLSPASAQLGNGFYPTTGFGGGMRGYNVDSPSSDTANTDYGLLFTLLGSPTWALGMTKLTTSGTSHDFYLNSYTTMPNGSQPVGQVFNVRSDTGQVAIGPTIGTNTSNRQVQITAGTQAVPLAGLQIISYFGQNGLVLSQNSSPPNGGYVSKNVRISLNGVFQVGSDRYNNSGNNYYLADTSSGNVNTWLYPFLIQNTGGASPVDALTLGASNDQVGFYGATPISKPVIMGARCDGTALANLLQKLQAMGLIVDQSTP